MIILVICLSLLSIDYINVKVINNRPLLVKNKIKSNNTIYYDSFLYDVFCCNRGLKNEYLVIERNSSYNKKIVDIYCEY